MVESEFTFPDVPTDYTSLPFYFGPQAFVMAESEFEAFGELPGTVQLDVLNGDLGKRSQAC